MLSKKILLIIGLAICFPLTVMGKERTGTVKETVGAVSCGQVPDFDGEDSSDFQELPAESLTDVDMELDIERIFTDAFRVAEDFEGISVESVDAASIEYKENADGAIFRGFVNVLLEKGDTIYLVKYSCRADQIYEITQVDRSYFRKMQEKKAGETKKRGLRQIRIIREISEDAELQNRAECQVGSMRKQILSPDSVVLVDLKDDRRYSTDSRDIAEMLLRDMEGLPVRKTESGNGGINEEEYTWKLVFEREQNVLEQVFIDGNRIVLCPGDGDYYEIYVCSREFDAEGMWRKYAP